MADEIDQDIDPVLADQLRQLGVGELDSPAQLAGAVAQMAREIVLLRRIGIADDLELLGIVVNDDAAECVARRLMAKMAAYVSDAEPPAGVEAVWMFRIGRQPQAGRPFGAFGLQAFGRRLRIEIERKDETGVNTAIVWLQRKCVSQVPDRIFRSPEIDVGISAIE